MRKILFILLFFPYALLAQMSKEKAIKKLDLDTNNIITAQENILLYPRDLIYSVNNPDTVGYLSCISSNFNEFKKYFEKNDEALKIAVGEKIVRNSGSYADTLLFQSIDVLSKRFTSPDNTSSIDSNANYVLVFFWSPKTIDRLIIKNYKNYQKYITEHPELKIQLLAILNE